MLGTTDRRVAEILEQISKRAVGFRSATHRGLIPRIECHDIKKRKELERNPARWLAFFFPQVFNLNFSKIHHEIIKQICQAVKLGTSVTIAAPRGYGKSTIAWGLSLYFLFTRQKRFPLVIAWNIAQARSMLRDWLRSLQANENLLLMYPEYVLPFWFSVRPVTLARLKYEDNNEGVYADVRLNDGIIMLPENIGAIGVNSVNGNIRGTHVVTFNGEWLRPDFVLLDDPQNREVAYSPAQVNDTMRFIEADIKGLPAPSEKLTIVATVTIIKKDDVADKLLSSNGAIGLKYQHVICFPKNWHDQKSETRKLWSDWWKLYEDDIKAETKNALAFYREHKKTMTDGFKVAWQYKYNRETEPDAYYATMLKWFTMGESAFMAEYQNQPLEEKNISLMLDEKRIMSHISDYNVGFVPDDCVFLTAGTDINLYGLHTVIMGVTKDYRAYIVKYLLWDNNGQELCPENAPPITKKRAIYEALVKHGAEITSPIWLYKNNLVRVQQWLIDAGYESEVVKNYIISYGKFQGVHVYASRGYDSLHYLPTSKNVIGTPREKSHLTESPATGRYIAYDADYWREAMLQGFFCEKGNIGSIMLPAGNHLDYIEHILRIRLIEKITGNTATAYKWNITPGRHDWADATMLCLISASFFGLSGKIFNSAVPKVRQYVETRKRRHVFGRFVT